MFENEDAKQWFEDNYKLKLLHDHYIKEEGYSFGDFIYDAGYCGYVEAEEIVKDLKNHGVTEFKELRLCDTEDFKVVNDANGGNGE